MMRRSLAADGQSRPACRTNQFHRLRARNVLDVERAVPVSSLCLLLLGMALIVPAALQVPYRNLPPAFAALRRVRGFLK